MYSNAKQELLKHFYSLCYVEDQTGFSQCSYLYLQSMNFISNTKSVQNWICFNVDTVTLSADIKGITLDEFPFFYIWLLNNVHEQIQRHAR